MIHDVSQRAWLAEVQDMLSAIQYSMHASPSCHSISCVQCMCLSYIVLSWRERGRQPVLLVKLGLLLAQE